MPCRGNGHTADDYQQILDEISEILTKYGGTAKFVIGGDMNTSFRRASTQDKKKLNSLPKIIDSQRQQNVTLLLPFTITMGKMHLKLTISYNQMNLLTHILLLIESHLPPQLITRYK